MAGILTEIGNVLAIELATIGTVSVTLGLMAAISLVVGAAVGFAKRARK